MPYAASNAPLQPTKSSVLIEDELYFGNTDKLMFLMKEFKMQISPKVIHYRSNPLLVAKLSIPCVEKFNFPRVKQKDMIFKESEELTPD